MLYLTDDLLIVDHRRELATRRRYEFACDGASITTIEGVQPSPDVVHPIQEQFMQCGAAQCGFCTPGFVVMAKALLDANPHPTRDEIRFAIAGNICRCTGYTKIIEAIEKTAEAMNPDHNACCKAPASEEA